MFPISDKLKTIMIKDKIRKIYIGVAWPYVNEIFHLGNLVGAYLPPDIFSRFHKLCGNEVLMISGSDFHGTPITLRAEKEGVEPEVVAERFHQLDKEYLQRFRIDYSLYTSTHTENHKKVVQEMFLRLLENGFIKILKTKQLYSEKSKRFLQDRYVEGECPYCHSKDARGDQCEACGRVLDSLELIKPVSKIDKDPLTIRETENYFLDLEKLQAKIKEWLLDRKDWRDWVKKEAMGWIEEGLRPRAITRDLDYGVPLPVEKIPKKLRIENIEHKVLYVWFEATGGYLSGAIEYSKKIEKLNYWKKFFYAKDGETYYFVGQDNLVFHTINWPAQLLAYDPKINLPTNVFVNKFLLLEGKKMSKSHNWYLSTEELVKDYTIDSLRFYLSLNMPETKEFSFSWQDFLKTNNSVLVGTIGNFIHRVLSFAQNNFGREFILEGFLPSEEVKEKIDEAFKKSKAFLDKGEFRQALQEIIGLCIFSNQFFDRNQPWKVVKESPETAEETIKNCLLIIENLRILIYPFLPDGAEGLSKFLGYKEFSFDSGLDLWQFSRPEKIILDKDIKPLFPKIEEEKIEKELAKLKQNH